MHRRPALAVAGLLSLALALTACTDEQAPTASVTAPAVSSAETVEPTEAAETVAPAVVPSSAAPSVAPSAAAKPAAAPKPTYDVAAVQRQLTDLRYYVGPVDGKAGPSLRSAVMAFQKVQGLRADGAVGKGVLAALAAPKAPALKGSAPANRVEVDLTKQVLYVVKGGAVSRIMPVSSGNGATYLQKDGSKARALTPTGYYTIQRRIVGERKADLGILYDPQYFYRGWAIHGSNSVPAGPASHGCVRVTRTDAKYLLNVINNGTTVYLYGGTHTFTAGSAAPGTDNPTGDGAAQPASTAPATQPPASSPPPATTAPSPSQSPSPSPSQTSSPSPSQSPSPSPSTVVPTP